VTSIWIKMIHQKQRDESVCASQPAAGSESAAVFAAAAASGSSFPCDDSFWKVFDDVCKDYMLTPPQSPPVGLAFDNEPLLMDESLSAALDSLLEETSGLSDPGLAQVIDSFESDMQILSDCMWSGSDDCKSITGKSSESSLLLAAGSAFENILTVSEEPLVAAETLTSNFDDENDDDDDDENEVPDSSDSDECDEHIFISSCSRLCPGADSLIDHSYGSTCPPDPPAAQSPHKSLTRSPAKATKRLSSSSSSASSSCSSTSLLSNEYHTGKSRRLAEKRRAKQKLLDADPVTVKFVKRTPTSGSPVGRKQAIRCAKRKSVTLAACTERLSSAMATLTSCPPESPARVSNLSPKSIAKSLSPVPSHASSSQSSCLSSCSSPQSILSSPNKKKKEKHFPERRREHNDSEKKRRDQLRNAFVCLRDQIPKLRDQGRRPPRIHILFEAASYVTTLAEKSATLEKVKNAETAKRDKLLRRLRMLQSHS
jgi:hypothetical protein